MAGESKKDQEEVGKIAGDVPATATEEKKVKKSGVISRIWNSVFRLHDDDFEKRLQRISKEEAALLARMKKRALTWGKMSRHLIIFSVLFEVIAVGYAIMTTRTLDINKKTRALSILPMFLLPALASLTYLACVSFTKMCNHNDHISLERLRTERQEKINELKEKTNYYTTQQLIQRYDPDPAAKAAAATVLASKLGADSGLQLFMRDEMKYNSPIGRSSDTELVQSSGLRKRKQPYSRPGSPESTVSHYFEEEMMQYAGSEGPEMPENDEVIVQHQNPTGFQTQDSGWLARLAALLVGEDPTQSYALICGSCHRHNGLARKEDFAYITYYCPHCNALNRPKKMEGVVSDSHPLSMGTSLVNSPVVGSSTPVDDSTAVQNASASLSSKVFDNSCPVLNPSASMSNKEPDSSCLDLNPSASMGDKEPDNSMPDLNANLSVNDKVSNNRSPVEATVENRDGSETSS